MNSHLHECYFSRPCTVTDGGQHDEKYGHGVCMACGHLCICEELRAVRRRTLAEAVEAAQAAIIWPSNWDRTLGVNAAITAIEGLGDE